MNQDEQRFREKIKTIAKVVLIILVAFIAGAAIFFFFKIRVEAKAALRDAKNVRLALRSADIEMYAIGKAVYNPDKKNGVEDGVKERVNEIFEPDGIYIIDGYNYSRHEMTSFTYKVDNYIVSFDKDGNDIVWDVDFKLDIYHFEESDELE